MKVRHKLNLYGLMKIELLPEPKIEFADDFLCDDPKMGISVSGFYSLTNNSHRSEIHYACIGTKRNIQDLQDWLSQFQYPIKATSSESIPGEEAEIEEGEVNTIFSDEDFDAVEREDLDNVVNKKLNPDFPGFTKESIFQCELLNDSANNINIKSSVVNRTLEEKATKLEKLDQVINYYVSAYEELVDSCITKPDICFLVIPTDVFKKLSSIPKGKQHINFRRKLKAELMACKESNIPIQIILEDTIRGQKKQLQDLSMIAWNFAVAQYYKTSNCIPWVLNEVDKDTCFIGISFHRVINSKNNQLRSTIAQAFNREGKGLIFVGKQFEWNSRKTKSSAPHLSYEYAKDLIKNVLKHYTQVNKHTPRRIVVHKTTDFWDSFTNKEYAEIEGIEYAIKEELGDDVEFDLVTIKSSKINLLRTIGKYPVIRGSLLHIDDFEGVLYTTGYVPYYETFPGVHMPHGLSIEIFSGESTLREICKEILALTKLNFNNCNYYSSLPITLLFAKKVGEIIQYLPESVNPPDRYYYYM